MLSWQYLNPRNDSLDRNEVKWGGYMKFLSSQIDMCFIEFQKKSQKWLGFKNLQSKVRHLGMSASISHHILSRLTSDMFFTVWQHLSCLCHVVYELPWAIHLSSLLQVAVLVEIPGKQMRFYCTTETLICIDQKVFIVVITSLDHINYEN